MPGIIAVITEVLVCIAAMWVISFLSTFLHEFGHAVGYMLSTGGRRWHIRVGSGKKLFETKAVTVNLSVFDGYFEPAENRVNTKGKLISTLAGGPAASLVLAAAMLLLKSGGVSYSFGIFAPGAIEYLINFAFFYNVIMLAFSVVPVHYFFGANKGMETDGLKIINAIKGR